MTTIAAGKQLSTVFQHRRPGAMRHRALLAARGFIPRRTVASTAEQALAKDICSESRLPMLLVDLPVRSQLQRGRLCHCHNRAIWRFGASVVCDELLIDLGQAVFQEADEGR